MQICNKLTIYGHIFTDLYGEVTYNYEKIILSMNTGMDASYEGIKSINLCDWLLGD